MTELALNELLVVPTGHAWHKARELTPANHRLAMAELAFAEVTGAKVDPLETQRSGPSFTVDTLRAMTARQPDADLFLIMGADQAAALTTWRDWQAILQIAIICVADRSDLTGASTSFEAETHFPERFLHLSMPAMTLSATHVRAAFAAGQPIKGLVCEAVARYIAEHHLYP